jgi:phage-related protein
MRRVSWVRAAFKDFQTFPQAVQEQMKFALQLASEGEMADISKPMKGFDGGVHVIALPYRGDAFRAVYAVKIGVDIWVVHAFQKKSVRGIKTPLREIEVIAKVIKARLKRLKEQDG